MQLRIGIIEVIMYVSFGLYSIYIPLKEHITTRKLKENYYIIKNPVRTLRDFFMKSFFILSTPTFVLLLAPSFRTELEDLFTVYFCFSIFLIMLTISFFTLKTTRGNYYLDSTGIHFLRNKKFDIHFTDITESKWMAYANVRGAVSTAKLKVKRKHITLYNMTKEQFETFISKDNVFIQMCEPVISIWKRAFQAFTYCIGGAYTISFFTFMRFATAEHGGSAMTETVEYSLHELLHNPAVPHYLEYRDTITRVSYDVWKRAFVLGKLTSTLLILVFLCALINILWDKQIKKKCFIKM